LKKVLGKGLDALLPSIPDGVMSGRDDGPVRGAEGSTGAGAPSGKTTKKKPAGNSKKTGASNTVVELEIGRIEPNPGQPRKSFDGDALNQLAQSISEIGVIQPIIVTDEGGYYKIIAGERRWRAARIAGLATVPSIIRGYVEGQAVEVALIENLQREDLNPVEEANGYNRLIAEYGYTQERIARVVGKSRPAIANSIRLLKLSEHIRGLLSGGALSAGHARALLAAPSGARRNEIADAIVDKGLNVRQAEALVNKLVGVENLKPGNAKGAASGAAPGTTLDATPSNISVAASGDISGGLLNNASGAAPTYAPGGLPNNATGAAPTYAPGGISVEFGREAGLKHIEDELRKHLSTRVTLDAQSGKTGRIIIEFYGDEDLQRLLEQLGLDGLT